MRTLSSEFPRNFHHWASRTHCIPGLTSLPRHAKETFLSANLLDGGQKLALRSHRTFEGIKSLASTNAWNLGVGHATDHIEDAGVTTSLRGERANISVVGHISYTNRCSAEAGLWLPCPPPLVYRSPISLVELLPIGMTFMVLSKILPQTPTFVYGVQAGLNMAKCAAGFDWVRTTCACRSENAIF